MKKHNKNFVIINETKHYPITFISYRQLIEYADVDDDIKHPLGTVYRAKIAHPDNMVRTVVLKNNSLPYNTGLEAFIFDKTQWLRYRNPFSPDYDETKTI